MPSARHPVQLLDCTQLEHVDSTGCLFDPVTADRQHGGMIAAMKDDKGRKMVSCREAAETYGCSMRYIRKLVSEGRLTHEIVAGGYMVALDEVRQIAGRKASGRAKKRSEGFKAG